MIPRFLTNRRYQVILLWAIAILILCFSPLRFLLNRETLIPYLERLGIWSPFLFVSIYAISMVIGFPTVIFTIAGGAVFGLLWGTVYSVVGATLGAMGALWLTRYLFREWVEDRFGHNPTLQKFQRGIADQALWFVLSMRLIPVTPFNVENYLFGLTLVDWRPYLIGTIIGIIPGTIAYTWLGVTGAQALEGRGALSFFLAVGLLLFISISPILLSSWRRRRLLNRLKD